MDEQKLRQLFKNRANCYADADDVIQAMDEDCFIETMNEALRLFAVSNRKIQQTYDSGYEDGYQDGSSGRDKRKDLGIYDC